MTAMQTNRKKTTLSTTSSRTFRPGAIAAFAMATALLLPPTAHAAVPFYDGFNYTAGGTLASAGSAGGWANSKSAITVATGSLDGTSLGLVASAGNMVTVNAGTAGANGGTDVDFVTTDITSGNVYFSFLLKINATTGIATASPGTPVINLGLRGSGTKPYFSVNLLNNSGSIAVGVAKYAATTTSTSSAFFTVGNGSALVTGTTYLVVAKYQFVSGTANDVVTVWLNPVSLGSASEDSTATNQVSTSSGADGTGGVGRVYVDAGFSASVDELRISTNWADVTPSVVCSPASITSGATPASQTAYVGGTASFAVIANGTSPAYQWQVSTDSGATWNNAAGTGATTASYTTPTLANGDNNSQFRCIASVGCGGGSSVTSAVASVTVVDPTTYSFRTKASGAWADPAIWQQSTDGVTWADTTATPTYLNSNILVQTGHTVTVTNPVTADDLTIQAGGEVDVSGAAFTINNGSAAVDCDVFGTVKVLNVANSVFTNSGTPGIVFESSGHFIAAKTTAPVASVPTATWQPGSTSEIQGTSGSPAGLGQNFSEFTWNYPAAAGSIDLAGALTTVLGDLTITAPAASGNGLKYSSGQILNAALTVTSNVTVTGYFDLLGGSVNGSSSTLNIGENLTLNPGGYLDVRSSGAGAVANVVFNKAGRQNFNNLGGITHSANAGVSGKFAWRVNTNSTTVLAQGNLTLLASTNGPDSLTVDGSLNFNGNQVTGPGNLTADATSVLIGNGTNQITTGLANISYGGTLNLGTLPPLSAGQSFKLFDATVSYSGTFTSIVPSPGVGLDWDASQLATNGTLAVITSGGGGGGGNIKITSITLGAGNVVLNATAGVGNANTNYIVLTSGVANLARTLWATNGTGVCDSAGNIAYTNSTTPGSSPVFYWIKIP